MEEEISICPCCGQPRNIKDYGTEVWDGAFGGEKDVEKKP